MASRLDEGASGRRFTPCTIAGAGVISILSPQSLNFEHLDDGRSEGGIDCWCHHDLLALPMLRALCHDGKRLHDSYTLLCRHDNPAPEAESSGGAEGSGAASASTSGLGELESSPLSELLTVRVPQGLQVSQQACDLLVLLNVLEALNRCALWAIPI